MQKSVLVSVPVVSTVLPKVAWSFELYLYIELTVSQVSHCCPLGRLVNNIINNEISTIHFLELLFLSQ